MEIIKKKRIRRKPGQVLRIPLGKGVFGYCQTLPVSGCAFFDYKDDGVNTDPQFVIKQPVIFEIGVNDYVIQDGFWEVISVLPVNPEFDQSKRAFTYSSATGKTVRFSEKVGESSTKAPYNPRAFEQHLNNTYGAENVNSSTLLRPSERMVHMASQRHPVTGIVYDVKGNPIFDPVAVFDVKFPSSKALEVMPDTHKAMATRELAKVIEGNPALKAQFNAYQLQDIAAGERTIEGYIWHHHQDIGRMQLIPDSLHIKTGHVGEDLWRRGLDNAK
jgi:hypothetical protein